MHWPSTSTGAASPAIRITCSRRTAIRTEPAPIAAHDSQPPNLQWEGDKYSMPRRTATNPDRRYNFPGPKNDNAFTAQNACQAPDLAPYGSKPAGGIYAQDR